MPPPPRLVAGDTTDLEVSMTKSRSARFSWHGVVVGVDVWVKVAVVVGVVVVVMVVVGGYFPVEGNDWYWYRCFDASIF